jgi:hypothetical protein
MFSAFHGRGLATAQHVADREQARFVGTRGATAGRRIAIRPVIEAGKGDVMSARRGGRDVPGPEEEQELAREDERAARDELRESADLDVPDEYDDEETVDEILQLDQTELDELGLTLDDPHQPEGE